jgi:hypothetical protein
MQLTVPCNTCPESPSAKSYKEIIGAHRRKTARWKNRLILLRGTELQLPQPINEHKGANRGAGIEE